MTKIYISSPLRLNDINQAIGSQLHEKLDVDVFLPISLHNDPDIEENTSLIAKICYEMIDQCSIIILVIPYGLSTAAEIGYAYGRRHLGEQKTIIAYFSGLGNVKEETMVDCVIDYKVFSLQELVDVVCRVINNSGA